MLTEKHRLLRAELKDLTSMAVAFSGGVDSSLLLYLVHQELKDGCLAVTAHSCLFPERELRQAQAFCREYGIEHVVIEQDPFSIEGFSMNPHDRCYLCKSALFAQVRDVATSLGIGWIAEGSNLDDEMDYRPGMKALAEYGVRSPLKDAGLTRAEIRELSLGLGLPTADKPSFACLATRFAFGDTISADGLARVDRAEQFLLDEGFGQVRVRCHGSLARIETDEEGMLLLSDVAIRQRVYDRLIEYGFTFVSLDLKGYRSGSMNCIS